MSCHLIKSSFVILVAALIFMAGVWAIEPKPVQALPIAFSGVPNAMSPGQSVSFTATYTDDDPFFFGVSLQVSGPGTLTACSVNPSPGRFVSFFSPSQFCFITEDVDTISQTVTISATLLCTSQGTITLSLLQNTTISTVVNCSPVLLALAAVPSSDGKAINVIATYPDDRISAPTTLSGSAAKGGVFKLATLTLNNNGQSVSGIGTPSLSIGNDLDTISETTTVFAEWDCRAGTTTVTFTFIAAGQSRTTSATCKAKNNP